jgi:hypothetical protein
MGVESNFYIMPDDSGYRPEPAKLCELVKAMRAAGFLCDPGSPGFVASVHRSIPVSNEADYEGFMWKLRPGPDRHAGSLATLEQVWTNLQDGDAVAKWPNSDLLKSGLKYPLTLLPGKEGVYYDIEMHLASQTVYHVSEIIEPFQEIRCRSGCIIQQMETPRSSPIYDSRLPNRCSSCAEPMNYATLPLTIRDGFTGVQSKVVGGAVYRFAVVVDCGKYWPEEPAQVTPEFLGVIERTLNIRTRVLRDYY